MRDKKILIIDFDDTSVNILSKFLQEKGFKISIAMDGQSGLEQIESETPDLIILEPMLPKLHGFELCRSISQNSGKEIPIIIVTGFYREEQYKTEALQSFGASAFFKKPYKKEEILCSILDLLKDKTEEKAKEEEEEEADQALEAISEKEQENLLMKFNTTETEMREFSDIKNQSPESFPSSKTTPSEKEKKPEISKEIDEMLKDTLSEFGLNLGTKKPPAEDKQKKIEDEEKEEREIKKPEYEPFERKKIEEKVTIKHEYSPFSQYTKETKKTAPQSFLKKLINKIKMPAPQLIVPFAIAGLIAVIATFYLLKPRNVNSISQENASLVMPNLQQEQSKAQATQSPSRLLTNEKEKEEISSVSKTLPIGSIEKKAQQIPSSIEALTPSNAVSEKSSLPPSSEVSNPEQSYKTAFTRRYEEPLLPDSAPFLELQENTKIETKTGEIESIEQINLDVDDNTRQEKKPIDVPQKIYESPEEKIKTGDLIALTLVDTPPILIKKLEPNYPPLAFKKGIEAEVMVNILISENGDVVRTKIINKERSTFGFNEASEKAVRQWKFKPAIKDGAKVKVWKPILIAFKKK